MYCKRLQVTPKSDIVYLLDCFFQKHTLTIFLLSHILKNEHQVTGLLRGEYTNQ